MIRVRVSHPFLWSMTNQFPGPEQTWGNCRFYLNEPIDSADFWVVLMDVPAAQAVPSKVGRKILVVLEFPEIKPTIAPRFLEQFDTVLSFGRTLSHPRVEEVLAPFPWMLGMRIEGMKVLGCLSFQEIEALDLHTKTREISVISSNKVVSAGHRRRLEFVEILKREFGDQLDVFGRGIKTFQDKLEAIGPYRYHIALENCQCPNGISEKLYDAYLGESFPIYYGCPNVGDYFPADALAIIDIAQPEQAIRIIRETIAAKTYEASRARLRECKHTVLHQYNIFALLADFCEREYRSETAKSTIRIAPEAELESMTDRAAHYGHAVKRRLGKLWDRVQGR